MEEGESAETLAREGRIDLYVAWENAMTDWMEDTEEMLKLYGARTLHFDSFRDSVFELIDLYTTTTDPKQYIGYMRKLCKAISAVNDKGVSKWRYPWPKTFDGKVAGAFRASLNNGGEAALKVAFGRWLDQQTTRHRMYLKDQMVHGHLLSPSRAFPHLPPPPPSHTFPHTFPHLP